MRIAALDLSKSSTGWAAFDSEGSGKPIYGSWVLGSSFTGNGRVFGKLHECMADLHSILPFDICYIEKPLEPALMAKINNFNTPYLLYNLAGHAESFCEVYGARFQMVHQATWRKSFIGGMRPGKAKKDQLKAMAKARAIQLGFNPKNSDEADAIGVLDYAIEVEGMTPPWRVNEILRMPL